MHAAIIQATKPEGAAGDTASASIPVSSATVGETLAEGGCCSVEEQASCCQPEAKSSCCGATAHRSAGPGSCGCR